ncbi:pilus assembly protein TadG-related protein [Gimibacter soli]|uniref:Pilus assembly protein TadG-related protein n=1 Tax=Gimibacter soli TaxID=3024400 RepID=A0AAF0BL58_9PROT|nr:pilus assembly protein TadG-related protein [Gimibacter soli]WCL55064.1 pilus assembly protein TadG-related protein [Gimibacter soli]
MYQVENRPSGLVWLHKFLQADSGGTLTMTAIMMPLILGFAGLGLDLSYWYMERRQVQNLADMAAIDGAHSQTYFDDTDLDDQVEHFLSQNGLDPARDTLSLSMPPVSGDYEGSNGYVEAVMAREAPLYFVSALYSFIGSEFTLTVRGRAVAAALKIGQNCIIALDPSAKYALDFLGDSDVTADCGAIANSTANPAVRVTGNAELISNSLQAVGEINIQHEENVTIPVIEPYAAASKDPYEDLVVPDVSGCDYPGKVAEPYETLSPGVYCGDIVIKEAGVTFEPGVYHLYTTGNQAADFIANAGAEIFGEGVTIILSSQGSYKAGSVTVNGGAIVDLTAPTSGDWNSILFFQDRYNNDSNSLLKFNGGATMNLNGAIYAPSAKVSFTGGASTEDACLLVVSKKIEFTGNSNLGNSEEACAALGLGALQRQERVQLVE